MSHARRFDHVGITVADLDAVTAFFVGLGLEVEGRTFVEGEFLDTVSGIPGSRTEIVMLRPPDGGTRLELSSFVRPDHEPGSPAAMANELGLRNVAFEVDDLQAAVDRLAADGYGLVGGIGQYEHSWRMAYVRGPEGIIVSLAERIGRRRRRYGISRTSGRAAPAFPTVPVPGQQYRPNGCRTMISATTAGRDLPNEWTKARDVSRLAVGLRSAAPFGPSC
jgi:catechol 2,3-dioxygenase-like lactoylglutathione lyase family enzyme